jgi:hypothetical protein
MKRSEESHGLLVIAREDLKQIIKERYEIGLTFLSNVITNEEQKEEWWDNFIEWDLHNVELIKYAFDKPNNSHVYSYERSGFAGFGYLGGEYKKPTFKESVESCREEMQYQVKRLKRFLDIIGILKESENIPKSENQKNKLKPLLDLLKRFHKVAQELREGRQNQETIFLKNEYDVQYLLNALLRIYFDDIRKEDSSPSNAGSNSRLDFVLKKEKIIIEVKMSSERLRDKELGEELLIDIGRYKGYPDCKDFVIFIYDKGDHIRNKRGFIDDLQKQSTNEFTVTVIINPE